MIYQSAQNSSCLWGSGITDKVPGGSQAGDWDLGSPRSMERSPFYPQVEHRLGLLPRAPVEPGDNSEVRETSEGRGKRHP